MTTKTQTRGHCQLCGRQQAYLRGAIAKHGYTVDHGYFNGVCHGAQYPAMELERTMTDNVIAQIREKDIHEMLARIEEIKGGWRPETVMEDVWCRETRKHVKVATPFGDLDAYQQQQWPKRALWNLEQRIKMGADFADHLEALAAKVHGQPMIEVKRAEKAAYIEAGEKRKSEAGTTLTASYQQGARVYYRSETGRRGWIGTQAWRKLEVVA